MKVISRAAGLGAKATDLQPRPAVARAQAQRSVEGRRRATGHASGTCNKANQTRRSSEMRVQDVTRGIGRLARCLFTTVIAGAGPQG
jgi:hypothetical protein